MKLKANHAADVKNFSADITNLNNEIAHLKHQLLDVAQAEIQKLQILGNQNDEMHERQLIQLKKERSSEHMDFRNALESKEVLIGKLEEALSDLRRQHSNILEGNARDLSVL